MSFRVSSLGSKNVKSNTEMALVLYSLAFSDKGKETLRQTFRDYSVSLVKKLEDFYSSLIKDKYWGEETPSKKKDAEKISKEELRKIIDSFKDKIQNLSDSDINELKSIIDQRYFIKNELLLEGLILGSYDFVKRFFKQYYDLIEFKYQTDLDTQLNEELLKLFNTNTLLSKEKITEQLGRSIVGLETYDTSLKNIDEERRIIQKNSQLIERELDYRNNALIQKITKTQNDPKAFQKFIDKKINPKIQSSLVATRDRIDEFDDEIFSLVQNVVSDLLKLRKKVITKDVYKTITGSY